MSAEPPVARVLASLPDEPRYVEPRGMLLSGHAEVSPEAGSLDEGFVVRVMRDAISALAVVGRPPAGAILRALPGTTPMTPIVVQRESVDHVARSLAAASDSWRSETAVLHTLARPLEPLSPATGVTSRFLDPADPLDHLPPGLRHEVTHARRMAPVACVLVGSTPAAFCYPCWRTETWWDVSIDTLEEYRGRGLAARAVALMAARLSAEGLAPVWGALASNRPSLRLAAKLGFVPHSEIAVFARGPWAFLTAGFEGVA